MSTIEVVAFLAKDIGHVLSFAAASHLKSSRIFLGATDQLQCKNELITIYGNIYYSCFRKFDK